MQCSAMMGALLLSAAFVIVHGSTKIPNSYLREMVPRCSYRTEDFWTTYFWNFGNANTIQLTLLSTMGTEVAIEEYFSLLLHFLTSSNWYKKSFVLMRHRLNLDDGDLLADGFKAVAERCTNTTSHALINLDTKIELPECHSNESGKPMQDRIQKFSGDSDDAFLLFVWDHKYLGRFLEALPDETVPKPRGTFMILLVSPAHIPYRSYKSILRAMWMKLGVLNAIVLAPCSCTPSNVYLYNPFGRRNSSRGRLGVVHIADIVGSPCAHRYKNSLRNMSSYPVKVSLFTRLPTAVKKPHSLLDSPVYSDVSYVGMDVMVLHHLASYLNFRPEFIKSVPDYGYKENGTYHGSLGDVVYRRADVSFNSRFVLGDDLDVVEYTSPIINDKFCIVVPKAPRVPQWRLFFHCFTSGCWMAIGLTYILASLCWYLVQPLAFTRCPPRRDASLALLDMFALFISAPIRMVTSPSHRMLFASCLLFSTVVLGTFQGLLVRSYTTSSHYPDVDTLEEFAKSDIIIESPTKSIENVFGDDGTEFFNRLARKIRIVSNPTNKIMQKRNVAVFERKSDILLRMTMVYPGKNLEEIIHIVKECPRSFHFNYIVPKGSPYLHVLNIVISQLRESGLVIKWNRDVVDALSMESKMSFVAVREEYKVFSMTDMKVAFISLVVGYLLSFIVCLLEMWHHTRQS